MTFELASQILKQTASLHASGFHFLQNYPNGVEGFIKDHPDFKVSGWFADQGNASKERCDEMISGMAANIHATIVAYGNDPELAKRMEDFIPNSASIIERCMVSSESHKFQTINHNDLHMGNIMYR